MGAAQAQDQQQQVPGPACCSTYSRGGIVRVNGRAPVWNELEQENQGQVQTAAKTIQWMLDRDNLEWGQRQDLKRVLAVMSCALKDGSTLGGDKDVALQHEVREMNLDASTLSYLSGFTHMREQKRYWKKVRTAVMVVVRIKRMTNPVGRSTSMVLADSLLSPVLAHNPDLKRELEMCDSWNEFDVFKVSKLSGSSVLLNVAAFVFDRWKLAMHFSIDVSKLEAFLKDIEKTYRDNPYHGNIHAADVTQTTHVLLTRFLMFRPSELEILAAVFAAICHDAGHLGVTNDFRVCDCDVDAITYNDLSVNENMHCAIAYRTLLRPGFNFLDILVTKQRASLRKSVVSIILGTDMSQHKAQTQQVAQAVADKGADVSHWEDSGLGLEVVVHGADLSNVGKPRARALQWTQRVQEEFFAQGDRERNLGRAISPLCDRETVETAGSQIGFISFVVRPLFDLLGGICNVNDVIQNLDDYKDYWQKTKSEQR